MLSSKINLDVLIFDMDGVLFDVSESYRAAIQQTTQIYFERLLGLAPFDGELVSRADIHAFKLAGGFNNDWDLTAALVKYFLSLIEERLWTADSPNTLLPLTNYLRAEGTRIDASVADLARRKDIATFTRQAASAGGGLASVSKILGNRNDHLLFALGNPPEANLVKRVFEEIYLGEELFAEEYGEAPKLFHGEGLIRREKLITNYQLLSRLSERVSLGIATGRPRHQALFSLSNARIEKFFRALVTQDDIVAAEKKQSPPPPLVRGEKEGISEAGGMSKPHPFSLLQAARRITRERARCAYIGDTLDDIRAANAAKSEMDFVSIGCLAVAEDKDLMRREFERVSADVIVDHPDELAEVVGN